MAIGLSALSGLALIAGIVLFAFGNQLTDKSSLVGLTRSEWETATRLSFLLAISGFVMAVYFGLVQWVLSGRRREQPVDQVTPMQNLSRSIGDDSGLSETLFAKIRSAIEDDGVDAESRKRILAHWAREQGLAAIDSVLSDTRERLTKQETAQLRLAAITGIAGVAVVFVAIMLVFVSSSSSVPTVESRLALLFDDSATRSLTRDYEFSSNVLESSIEAISREVLLVRSREIAVRTSLFALLFTVAIFFFRQYRSSVKNINDIQALLLDIDKTSLGLFLSVRLSLDEALNKAIHTLVDNSKAVVTHEHGQVSPPDGEDVSALANSMAALARSIRGGDKP
ncbi:MAG: hypothetical protein AAFS11_00755 [Planctomycetota bacterium]